MKYITAMKGAGLALIFFAIVGYVVKDSPRLSEGAEIILTVSTFLFAIFAGFYISRLNDRYGKMTDLIASEDAKWLSFYELSHFYPKTFVKKVEETLDKYYIVAYDFELGSCYKYNAKYFHEFFALLREVKIPKNSKSEDVFDDMLGILGDIEDMRNKSAVIANERLNPGQWTMIIVLSLIIIFSIFQLNIPSAYYWLTTVLFSTVIVTIVLTMRDLQNFRLNEIELLGESGQEVLEAIGRPRYYNKRYIEKDMHSIPKHIKEYRLGRHKPGSKTFDIIVVQHK